MYIEARQIKMFLGQEITTLEVGNRPSSVPGLGLAQQIRIKITRLEARVGSNLTIIMDLETDKEGKVTKTITFNGPYLIIWEDKEE